MREMALWLSGAALAFFATAGAFLLLANLATVPSEKSLDPERSPGGSGHALELQLDVDRLASLKPLPGQSLDLVVKNEGAEDLSDINVSLGVSSEDTSLPGSRYYRRTIQKLPAGGAADVHFDLDLSTPGRARPPAEGPEPARKILEIRAATPEGVSAVRTVILPP